MGIILQIQKGIINGREGEGKGRGWLRERNDGGKEKNRVKGRREENRANKREGREGIGNMY